MTNFQIILAALRTARSGAQTRVAMGLSLGDNAYSDCRARQLDDLLENLGLSYDPMDENSIGWDTIATFQEPDLDARLIAPYIKTGAGMVSAPQSGELQYAKLY